VVADFLEVDALPDSERGTGGFGHTGVAPSLRPGRDDQ
jgi:dUTPase